MSDGNISNRGTGQLQNFGNGDGKNEGGQVNLAFETDDHEPSKNEGTNSGDEAPVRDQWDNQLEFILSCISMSVGLGNIWRFPFTAYENGGGAFLIPYLIVLIFIGRPIYFLELVLGQFSSYGPVKVWNLAPAFKGLGYGSMIGTICVVSYYASIMAQTVFYFFNSFQATLPWSECNEDWVTLGRGQDPELMCNETDRSFAYVKGEINVKSNLSISQLYFENEVLKQKMQIDDGIGAPEWRMTLCLLFSWILICGTLIKGVSSSGKVAYFTALFPYLVLIIMLIRGVTLKGAWKGIKVFLDPEWKKMLEPKVWYAAVGQCFFSLGTGLGPIIMFSSYNPFRHNIYRDGLIVSLLDTMTSFLAGVTIFSVWNGILIVPVFLVLGSLAEELGLEVLDVAQGGPGLAFVSYPAAIARFDWVPQLFAVLFYLMLFTLAIGTITSLTGGVITIICDQFPQQPRWRVTCIVSALGFLSGLIYVTPGGQFMLNLVDHFGANFVIYVIATVEVIAVAWVYGLQNLLKDIEFMLEIRLGWYWKFCWGFFVPVGLSAILIYSLVTEKRLTYDSFSYPDSALVCGWIVAAMAVSVLPICAIHAIWTRKSTGLKERVKESFRPTTKWGPRKPSEKENWIAFKAKMVED